MKWHSILRVLNVIGDFLLMNLLFLGTSILTLGIGIGASWAALIATHAGFASDDTGYYVRNYWKHFKANFIMATGIFWTLVAMVGLSSLSMMFLLSRPNSMMVVVLIVGTMFLITLIAIVLPYTMAIIATRHTTIMLTLKLAILLAFRHLGWTLLQTILLILVFVLPMVVSFAFILIEFSMMTYVQSRTMLTIWRMYDLNP